MLTTSKCIGIPDRALPLFIILLPATIISGVEIKMSTLICFALKEEAAPFRKIAADGLRRGHHASILLTGIGRQNAEKSLREFLATHSPKLVLTCGFAGGLNPELKLGDIIFETSDETLR